MNKEGGCIPPGAEDFKADSTTNPRNEGGASKPPQMRGKEGKVNTQPESDAEAAASIENEMRAQMLLGDYKMLEKFLRVGFQKLIDVQPNIAKVVEGRVGHMKVSLVDALAQETRLRLTALNKVSPDSVSSLSKIVEFMNGQLQRRASTLKQTEKDESRAVPGKIQKMLWDLMTEQAQMK